MKLQVALLVIMLLITACSPNNDEIDLLANQSNRAELSEDEDLSHIKDINEVSEIQEEIMESDEEMFCVSSSHDHNFYLEDETIYFNVQEYPFIEQQLYLNYTNKHLVSLVDNEFKYIGDSLSDNYLVVDDLIYYVRGGLYCSNLQLENELKLLDDISTQYSLKFLLTKDEIYYVDEENRICSYDLLTDKKKVIYQGLFILKIDYYGEWIYFIERDQDGIEKIKRIKYDGEEEIGPECDFKILEINDNEEIIYSFNNYIYCYDFEKKSKETISEMKGEYSIFLGNMYGIFDKFPDALSMMNINSKEIETFFKWKGFMNILYVSNDYLWLEEEIDADAVLLYKYDKKNKELNLIDKRDLCDNVIYYETEQQNREHNRSVSNNNDSNKFLFINGLNVILENGVYKSPSDVLEDLNTCGDSFFSYSLKQKEPTLLDDILFKNVDDVISYSSSKFMNYSLTTNIDTGEKRLIDCKEEINEEMISVIDNYVELSNYCDKPYAIKYMYEFEYDGDENKEFLIEITNIIDSYSSFSNYFINSEYIDSSSWYDGNRSLHLIGKHLFREILIIDDNQVYSVCKRNWEIQENDCVESSDDGFKYLYSDVGKVLAYNNEGELEVFVINKYLVDEEEIEGNIFYFDNLSGIFLFDELIYIIDVDSDGKDEIVTNMYYDVHNQSSKIFGFEDGELEIMFESEGMHFDIGQIDRKCRYFITKSNEWYSMICN